MEYNKKESQSGAITKSEQATEIEQPAVAEPQQQMRSLFAQSGLVTRAEASYYAEAVTSQHDGAEEASASSCCVLL